MVSDELEVEKPDANAPASLKQLQTHMSGACSCASYTAWKAKVAKALGGSILKAAS